MRLRKLLAGTLVFIAGPAWAGESLINGEPLRYNYEYHCNGERIVVGRCRDNDDDSYCQDYYPDRPYHNGLMVQPVERRGDVIAKLNACARTASAQAPSSSASVPSLRTSEAPASAGVKPQGLGKATWRVLDSDDEKVVYYTAAGITRSGKSGRGWFTNVYDEPKDFGDGASGVTFMQSLIEANCTTKQTKLVQIAAYGTDQAVKAAGVMPNQSFERPEAGSITDDERSVICGTWKLSGAGAKPLVGDGQYLWQITRLMLALQRRDAEKQKQ